MIVENNDDIIENFRKMNIEDVMKAYSNLCKSKYIIKGIESTYFSIEEDEWKKISRKALMCDTWIWKWKGK
jgi:hypothetical protein